MTTTRQAYIKWGEQINKIVDDIKRGPNDQERAALLPAFHGVIDQHTLKHKDGSPLTVGDYFDFTDRAWVATQKSKLIRLLIEAEAK